MIINYPAVVENGEIVQVEKWEYYFCPKCDADMTQEEIDALHCKGCNETMRQVGRSFGVL
jgi:Zn finger protein HypA/HybF involved in hydrogenase expression